MRARTNAVRGPVKKQTHNMTTATTEIRELSHGYRYEINFGREPFYDENNDRMLGQPTHSICGWARFHAEAQSEIDRIIAGRDVET